RRELTADARGDPDIQPGGIRSDRNAGKQSPPAPRAARPSDGAGADPSEQRPHPRRGPEPGRPDPGGGPTALELRDRGREGSPDPVGGAARARREAQVAGAASTPTAGGSPDHDPAARAGGRPQLYSNPAPRRGRPRSRALYGARAPADRCPLRGYSPGRQ